MPNYKRCDYCQQPFKVDRYGGKISFMNDRYWHTSHYREGATQTWVTINECVHCGRKLSDTND